MSPSLINKLRYCQVSNFDDRSMGQLIDAVDKKPFVGNEFTRAGEVFEQEVIAGQHSAFKPYIEDVIHGKWYRVDLEFDKYIIRMSGQFDLVKKDGSTIYDIKRTTAYKVGKFSNTETVQHNVYFLMEPRAQDFHYLVGYLLKGSDEMHYTIESHDRPENVEGIIRQEIVEFLQFLYNQNLLPTYIRNFEVK